MKSSKVFALALLALALGCGGESTGVTPAPAMKNTSGPAVDEGQLAIDGKGNGESPFGPKRVDVDKKIAEIRANTGYSDDLKKQLIDEVERTYKEAQTGAKKS